MIVSQLHGGLGNQMFQYAMARKIGIAKNIPMKTDTLRYSHRALVASMPSEYQVGQTVQHREPSILRRAKSKASILKRKFYSIPSYYHYGTDIKRTYRLDVLNISSKPLGIADLVRMNVQRLLGKRYQIIQETTPYQYESTVLDCPSSTYFVGFWQNERYFKDIADTIQEEFTVAIEPDEQNRKMLEMIQNSNSICLHVRRGDYVAEQVANNFHGTVSLNYYQKGIEYIKSKVKDPHFFIFSDDPDWAKENIKTGYPTEVSYNPTDKEYEDLRLMYSCKHFIIANSTFSWWAAWLGQSVDKIVVAPENWIISTEFDSSDTVPLEWVRVD